MNTLGSYITQIQTLINDTSSSLFSTAQYTTFVNAARGQVSFDSKCIRTFFQNLNTINTQETYLYNGSIGGVNVVAGGANYSAPVITFVGGGGTGAAASAVVLNGAITDINMTNWGQNYSSAPTV